MKNVELPNPQKHRKADLSHGSLNSCNKVLGGLLAPSSYSSIFIETNLSSKAGLENDLSIAPVVQLILNTTNPKMQRHYKSNFELIEFI